MGILDPGQSTQDIIDHVIVLMGTSFTVIASPCFVLYCLLRWIWSDLGLKFRFAQWQKSLSSSSPDANTVVIPERSMRRSKPFLNINNRFIIGLHLSCFSNSLLRFINVFTSTEAETLCMIQGMLLQYTDWVMFYYNLAIALWLFAFIFFGKKIRSMPQWIAVLLEVGTHLFCILGAIFWLVLPLTTAPEHGIVYGAGGNWCWMRPDRMGKLWRMVGLYVPLWVMAAFIVVLYTCCILFVFISFHRLHTHEMKGLRGQKLMSRFSHQMFLVVRSKKDDITLIRLSNEWRAYTRLFLYPAIFLITWTMPTVNRVSQIFLDEPNNVLQILHQLTVSQQGFLSVLIFPLNPIQHLVRIRKILTCEYCRNRPKNDQRIQINFNLDEYGHDKDGGTEPQEFPELQSGETTDIICT